MTEPESVWARCLLASAGVLGVAGVGLGAASAHLGGGDLVRLAAEFLLFHAAAIPGCLGIRWVSRRLLFSAATCLAGGAALFSADVALLGFTGRTPIPGLAPSGGLLLILGWILVAVCAFTGRSGGASMD